ncbi:unnamed protein product [Leptosia nina]|uniref:Peptidase S1 domain-containing protein n=1 Tax=Leptosia nina TaxID=320188 RepID=A0AAV1JG59_9NEOP
MKCVLFVVLLKVSLSVSVKEICEQCIPIEECEAFTNMNTHDQESWSVRFPCDGKQNNKTIGVLGFSTLAKGDIICCPSSQVWGVNNLNSDSQKRSVSGGNLNNNTDPKIEPEYGNAFDQPNGGGNPYFGNQNGENYPNMYGNQRNPNLYGQQNYPNQNMYGLGNQQNIPNKQNGYGNQRPGGYGGFGQNSPTNLFGNQRFPSNLGYPKNNRFPGQNIDNSFRPNNYGGVQNPSNLYNQWPYGGQQTRPVNQNMFNNPRYGNPHSYPSTNGYPWDNQGMRPGYSQNPQETVPGFQNNPQTGLPNQVNPSYMNPNSPSLGFQNNPQTRLPNQIQPGILNPSVPVSGNPNTAAGYPNNPQTNLPNPGLLNPGLPTTGTNVPGYNPQTNVPNQVQPGVLNPGSPTTVSQNPPYESNVAYPKQPNQNTFGNDGVDDTGKPTLGQECKRMKTSFPPSPETGCCGRDMSDAERVTDLQSLLNMFAPPKQNTWGRATYPQQRHSWPTYQRRKRSVKNETTADVSLENRIAGGRETELDQFPWTVLMKTTFDYGTKIAAFSCGGSLISRRYVLTAGHCVYEPKATISDIEVTLAEYDKRTFPIDCITVFGGGRECVKNILMHAEDVVHHPEYDDDRLLNDIALVRLSSLAPYTRYIRPICLPTVNIDIPEFSNLPLAVAGWGRDHQYVTDIKQSTVVHLIPPEDCRKSYPHLSVDHLCAAGRTGEDTCKGDSGGPLMMLYKGSYFVIGIVSGKRADSPCGSKVPSLYTNVFHYVSWIRSTIRE